MQMDVTSGIKLVLSRPQLPARTLVPFSCLLQEAQFVPNGTVAA